MAGHHMNDAIIQFVRRKHNLLIGSSSAEKVKIEIGYADAPPVKTWTEIKGKDLIRQVPKALPVEAVEIYEALAQTVSSVVRTVRQVLERTPPELCRDIVERGIFLTGGGSLLRGFDRRIERETGIRTVLVEEPLLSVVKGTARLLEAEGLLERVSLPEV